MTQCTAQAGYSETPARIPVTWRDWPLYSCEPRAISIRSGGLISVYGRMECLIKPSPTITTQTTYGSGLATLNKTDAISLREALSCKVFRFWTLIKSRILTDGRLIEQVLFLYPLRIISDQISCSIALTGSSLLSLSVHICEDCLSMPKKKRYTSEPELSRTSFGCPNSIVDTAS